MFCCLQVKPLGFLKPSSLTKVASRFKAHQESLPRLPVPPLQQTLDHYLKTLQPIVSEEEWAHTKQLVEEFQAAGGVGERLQKGLERRAKKMENWVSQNRGYTDPPPPPFPPGLKGKGPPEAVGRCESPTVRSAPLHAVSQHRPLGHSLAPVSRELTLCLALGRDWVSEKETVDGLEELTFK